MGNCISWESRTILKAKLIGQDGQLREFSWPVKVSFLSPESSDCFICSSEEMEFGQLMAAMGGDEMLEPGELYFELPAAWRNHRMQAEDMALLAYKASVALAGDGDHDYNDRKVVSCCYFCGSRKIEPRVLFSEKERPLLAVDGAAAAPPINAAGDWRRLKLVAKLSAILEEGD
ncbi:uncharacterized protein LOC127260431 [Andrographis paniculata]|uniref:uncharacterized protein LOC127260431 n=1 Tax=Andrographis paniculata TaxID=175694 RepID=UPI0021E7EF32|nr:uncharacterized protein LOC127260431 [Andrographis paniculata]